jgi:uncharacterized protein YjdB
MKLCRIIGRLLIAVLLCGTGVLAEETVSPQSIKIVLNKKEMQVGESQKVKVSVTLSNAENYLLEYTSSNPEVITAAIGSIIANKEGTADITVRIKDTEISDTVTITVKQDIHTVMVSDIELQEITLYIERYEKRRIYYTIIPSTASNKNIIFISQNTAIATVDENGVVYGKKAGNTKIQVQSGDGQVTKYVKVYVNDEDEAIESGSDIPVRRVDIYCGEDEVTKTIEIMRTKPLQFTATITPDSATDKLIRWKSSDEDIAEVDENGVVTGVSEGTAKIYAIARDNGRQDSVTVKVVPYVRYPDSFSIIPEDNAVWETGNTICFTPLFMPVDTTETLVTWVVYGDCATIDENGKITITDKGKGTVKAYTADWKLSAVYEFDASYHESHFEQIGEAFYVKPDRAIVISFDTDVNSSSAQMSIFSTAAPDGNGQNAKIHIAVNGNTVSISAPDGWDVGENYIFIKSILQDIYGNLICKSMKYKFTVRGMQNEAL